MPIFMSIGAYYPEYKGNVSACYTAIYYISVCIIRATMVDQASLEDDRRQLLDRT